MAASIRPLSAALLEEHNNDTMETSQQLPQTIPPTSAPTGFKKLNLTNVSLSQVQENQQQQQHAKPQAGTGQKGLAGLMMMKRKVKTWKKGGAGSTMGSSIRSGPKVQLENTYRLEPNENESFNEAKIKGVVGESIKLFMAKQSAYNPTKSAQVSRYLSEDIKTRVKQLNMKRYKFVVHVMIGQSNEQGMQYSTRCVWDDKKDNVATVVYRHKDIFIVANVFATYFD